MLSKLLKIFVRDLLDSLRRVSLSLILFNKKETESLKKTFFQFRISDITTKGNATERTKNKTIACS